MAGDLRDFRVLADSGGQPPSLTTVSALPVTKQLLTSSSSSLNEDVIFIIVFILLLFIIYLIVFHYWNEFQITPNIAKLIL